MIIKSANLIALQYLLTEPEETMEKLASMAKNLTRGKVRYFKGRARSRIQRQPAVREHNAGRLGRGQQNPPAVAPQQPASPVANTTQNPFNTQGNSFSGGTPGGTMQWDMPQPGPSFRHGMSQVGQGFGEMGSAIAQGGRNAINRGLQAGSNAANAVKNGLQTAGTAIANGARTAGNAIVGGVKATGNAIAGGARAVKNGLQTAGTAIANGANAVGGAVMNGGRNALEWAQKNPGLALGGGYMLYDQLTDN